MCYIYKYVSICVCICKIPPYLQYQIILKMMWIACDNASRNKQEYSASLRKNFDAHLSVRVSHIHAYSAWRSCTDSTEQTRRRRDGT